MTSDYVYRYRYPPSSDMGAQMAEMERQWAAAGAPQDRPTRDCEALTNRRTNEMTTEYCKFGHERTEENTYWKPRGSKRYRECRTCRETRTPRSKKKQAIRLSHLEVIVTQVTAGEPCGQEHCKGTMRAHWYDDDITCSLCSKGATAVMGEQGVG